MLGSFINSLVTAFLVVVFIEVIFSLSPQVNGWLRYQLLFLTGIYRIMLSVFATFFLTSVNRMTSYIHRGELDLLLTKPINSQFLLTFKNIKPFEMLNSLPGWIIILYSLQQFPRHEIHTLNILFLIISLITGLIILYSLYFMLGTLAVWLKRFSSLNEIYYVIREPLSIPVDFFGRTTSLLLTFIFPLALIITIPLKISLNKIPSSFLLISIVAAAVFLYLSKVFWNFSLKHYTSTGS
ncbi:ABC-2 family transporter protein [Candidatus Daviesbacteria bacterium]|nr:ABC-2 family transporter protein [Candidatus Daviesbacteria bacterium]